MRRARDAGRILRAVAASALSIDPPRLPTPALSAVSAAALFARALPLCAGGLTSAPLVAVIPCYCGAISAGDINGLWAALPIRYRNPALAGRVAWMSHTGVNGDIQQLGQEEGAAFTVNFTAEGVTRLKGRDMYENDYFADLPSGTAAANLLVVGDWSNFVVAQRAGMNIELVPHVFDVTNSRPTGERAWYAWARVGADSVNDLGFRLLQNNDGS